MLKEPKSASLCAWPQTRSVDGRPRSGCSPPQTMPVQDAATPDTAQLAVTAAALTVRLGAGTDQLASCARWLIDRVRERLDSASADNLATATLRSYQRLAAADPTTPNIGAT